MDAATVDLIIAAMRAGTMAMNQAALLDLDSLPPEKREELLAARDAHNAAWAALAPKG